LKAAEQFSEFHEKYLKGSYTGQIPLVEYDSKYASVKHADKVTVDITIYFDNGDCQGRQFLLLRAPKYYSILDKLDKDFQRDIKFEYVYKDGKLKMMNEEYVIDTSTGELKNITRNFTLKKK
jgi:hypothetical protein